MRSFISVAAGVLLLVCASVATPSVKLPNKFTVPKDAQLTGEMLYNSLAYSQKTLSRRVDVSLLATNPELDSTLLGSTAKHPATLLVIPEELAPQDVTGTLADNAFPLTEMSMTLSTAAVEEGMSTQMKEAFYNDEVRRIVAMRNVKMSELASSLKTCGVELVENINNGFTLNGAKFGADDVNSVLYASAIACSNNYNEQVTVVDLRSAYTYAMNTYGEGSAQIEAVEKMIRSVVEFLSGKTLSFLIASNDEFYANQRLPSYDFAVVPPHMTASLPRSAQEKKSSMDTGIFQITLWFTIFIVAVVLIFSVLTCGVGIDIEKDTLLYQTTALRGQPVL